VRLAREWDGESRRPRSRCEVVPLHVELHVLRGVPGTKLHSCRRPSLHRTLTPSGTMLVRPPTNRDTKHVPPKKQELIERQASEDIRERSEMWQASSGEAAAARFGGTTHSVVTAERIPEPCSGERYGLGGMGMYSCPCLRAGAKTRA
jgi:hypothetical protein